MVFVVGLNSLARYTYEKSEKEEHLDKKEYIFFVYPMQALALAQSLR